MELLPDAATLRSWATLQDAAAWGGLDAGLVRCVARQVGDANLASLQVLAVIPLEILEQALQDALRGDRGLTEVEKAQWRLVLSAVRVKYGSSALFGGESSGSQRRVTGAEDPVLLTSGAKLKLKMNQIIDQGCDFEVEMLPAPVLQKMRGRFVMVEGDNPLDREEVTDAQLTCLFHKVQGGQTPFVDMAVWGPHGERIARAMKFVSQQWRDGQWKAVELPGASSLDAWEESWRIFRTAAIMTQLASAATLDRYAAEFRTRVLQHPEVWHLAAQSDIRCRTELWAQEKRKLEAFHASHPALSAFVPEQPWNSVIRSSASHQEFWAKEFEKPAMLYALHSARATPARPDRPPLDVSEAEKSTPKKKSTYDPQRKDGRYFKSKAGINICYAWTRSADGCNDEKCEKGFAHVCEWCRQPHKSINCPQNPGWTATEPKGKKDKGKGKGRGGNAAAKRQRQS